MFSPAHWVHGENITVKQFCDYLQQYVPEDEIFVYVVAVRYICTWEQ